MKQQRRESIFFQRACEAIANEDQRGAFTLLKTGLAKASETFADQVDVLELIAEIIATILLLEPRFKVADDDVLADEVRRKPDTKVCSFCCRAQPNKSKVVAGPGVLICEECIRVCIQALDPDKKPD